MKFPLVLLLALWCCSCTTPSPINIKAEPQNDQMVNDGVNTFTDYKKRWPQVPNAQVARVGQRLKSVIPQKGMEWEFITFDFTTPNAFALPGGKVGVNTGILSITKTDAGVATIIAHEIAHVLKNHHLDRKRRRQALNIVANLKKSGKLTDTATVQQNLLSNLPTYTEMEIEADQVGLIYMAKAGYNPEEAIAFWKRFASRKNKQGINKTTFLKTHPLDSTRMAKLYEILPYAKKVYNQTL